MLLMLAGMDFYQVNRPSDSISVIEFGFRFCQSLCLHLSMIAK